MNLRTRRIIYSLFIVTFLVCAPLLVLYASGYRYNFKKTRFQKTGVLVIETEPPQASILLNEQATPFVTPARITQLRPNSYTLTLTKPEYQPWKSSLDVSPNQTTFMQHIQLFRKLSLPELIFSGTHESASLSNSGKTLAWQDKNQLTLYETKNNTSTIVSLPTAENITLTWSPHDQYLLLSLLNRSFAVVNNDSLTLSDVPGQKMIAQAQFDHLSDTTLFWNTGEDLIRYNLITKYQTVVLSVEHIVGFIPTRNGIYLAQALQESTLIQFYPYDPRNRKETIGALPKTSNITFVAATQEEIIIHEKEQRQLFIIHPTATSKGKKIQTIQDVTSLRWSPDKSRLLLLNDNEIRLYEFGAAAQGDNHQDVVIRSSVPIHAVAWHASGNALLYASSNELSAVDLMKRGMRNTWTLSPLPNITSLFPINNKEVLLVAPRGEQYNLFTLTIQ